MPRAPAGTRLLHPPPAKHRPELLRPASPSGPGDSTSRHATGRTGRPRAPMKQTVGPGFRGQHSAGGGMVGSPRAQGHSGSASTLHRAALGTCRLTGRSAGQGHGARKDASLAQRPVVLPLAVPSLAQPGRQAVWTGPLCSRVWSRRPPEPPAPAAGGPRLSRAHRKALGWTEPDQHLLRGDPLTLGVPWCQVKASCVFQWAVSARERHL